MVFYNCSVRTKRSRRSECILIKLIVYGPSVYAQSSEPQANAIANDEQRQGKALPLECARMVFNKQKKVLQMNSKKLAVAI